MTKCKCGSYAINHHLHGRDGSEPDLCDVCYWREKYEHARLSVDAIDGIDVLMSFYGVDTVAGVVSEQEANIVRLQESVARKGFYQTIASSPVRSA